MTFQICDDCGRDSLEQCHKYCRRCGAKNPFYVKPARDIAEPTKIEINLARRLFAVGIDFTLSPEIWYSSCTYYTPDFLIERRLIVEIDGQHHFTDPHQVLMDRIRQRAIQNSGYFVCRFTNKEVNTSIDSIVKKIEFILRTNISLKQASIIEVDIPNEVRLSNVHENILRKQAKELHELTLREGWDFNKFNEFLSKLSPSPVDNRCAMQRLMLMLLGLNFRVLNDGTADFENLALLFDKAKTILHRSFGEIAIVEFGNEFNITATNFLKNLIFYGGPKILNHRVIYIKNFYEVRELIKSFNSNFSKFGINVEEEDLKAECIHAKKRISEKLKKTTIDNGLPIQTNSRELEKFDWIDVWDK